MPHTFAIGDKALNPARPDWGVGTVTSVSAHVANGKQGQRLTIRFDGAGLKTVSTAIIDLTTPPVASTGVTVADLTALPASVLDTAAPLARRLTSATEWYRFRRGDRQALDWAIQKLAIADPLSVLSREQLHEAREGFFRSLDHMIADLARDLGRKDPEALATLRDTAPPAAQPFIQQHAGR